jgi:hypothetical protein
MANTLDPLDVRTLAYQLWQKREPFEGDAVSDWTRAEEMLINDVTLRGSDNGAAQVEKKTDHAVKESFPASAPPSKPARRR